MTLILFLIGLALLAAFLVYGAALIIFYLLGIEDALNDPDGEYARMNP